MSFDVDVSWHASGFPRAWVSKLTAAIVVVDDVSCSVERSVSTNDFFRYDRGFTRDFSWCALHMTS